MGANITIWCLVCRDTGHVCENHENSVWDEGLPGGCECGAGMPCSYCCSPVERGGSIIEAFTPDWRRIAQEKAE